MSIRFVVQKHHATRLHWDFRLEMDGVLKSWAVPKEPPLNPDLRRLAVQVEDHSLDHVDFQSPISEGPNVAGSTTIWDKGVYELRSRTENMIVFILSGEKMRGEYALIRTGYQGDMRNWLLYKASRASV